MEELAHSFRKHGGPVWFVELEATLPERLRRNETEFRLAEKPTKRDVVVWRERLLAAEASYQLNSHGRFAGRADYLRVEDTMLSAADVAERVIQHFRLPEGGIDALAT